MRLPLSRSGLLKAPTPSVPMQKAVLTGPSDLRAIFLRLGPPMRRSDTVHVFGNVLERGRQIRAGTENVNQLP